MNQELTRKLEVPCTQQLSAARTRSLFCCPGTVTGEAEQKRKEELYGKKKHNENSGP